MNLVNMWVFVTPISRKAKNRFANVLCQNPYVHVEQQRDGKVFVVSENKKWCSWISLHSDPDWKLS